MLRLAAVFHIDIAAFAVLSNHYHIVVHVRRDDVVVQGRVRYQLKTAYRDGATGPRSLLATPMTAIEV